jgi:hypothetical protein
MGGEGGLLLLYILLTRLGFSFFGHKARIKSTSQKKNREEKKKERTFFYRRELVKHLLFDHFQNFKFC